MHNSGGPVLDMKHFSNTGVHQLLSHHRFMCFEQGAAGRRPRDFLAIHTFEVEVYSQHIVEVLALCTSEF